MDDHSDRVQILDKIWITAKSRIQSEKRYRKYDAVTHILLCVLSIILIGITVLKARLPEQAPVEEYTVVFSVFVLVFSIVVFGFSFGETATLHRECYLRLQKLHDSRVSVEELETIYHEILGAYPNHSDIDFEKLIINLSFPNGKGLKRPNGDVVKWTWPMLIRMLFLGSLFWGATIALPTISVGSIFLF